MYYLVQILPLDVNSSNKKTNLYIFSECTTNSDCGESEYCDRFKRLCLDVCPSFCGENTDCSAANHNPICECKPGKLLLLVLSFNRCRPTPKFPFYVRVPVVILDAIWEMGFYRLLLRIDCWYFCPSVMQYKKYY